MPLLEKVYAKCFKSYERIESGLPAAALFDLTGVPVKTFLHRKGRITKENLWRELCDGASLGHIMCASIGAVDWSSFFSMKVKCAMNDLVNGHAYGLLDARELEDDSGNPIRLLKVRNPWGTFEWKGDWGDESDLWTDRLKEECDLQVNNNDGLFWICYDDFLEFFQIIDICYYQEKYWRTNILVQECAPNKRVLTFRAPEGVVGKYSFTLSQKDPRLFPRNSDGGNEKPTPYSKMAIWSYEGGEDAFTDFQFVDGAELFDAHETNLTVQV